MPHNYATRQRDILRGEDRGQVYPRGNRAARHAALHDVARYVAAHAQCSQIAAVCRVAASRSCAAYCELALRWRIYVVSYVSTYMLHVYIGGIVQKFQLGRVTDM